ncbi:hypothetical protein [Paraburkholderia fungorum]
MKVLEKMQNSVCLLLALALESEGLLRAKLARNQLPAHTNREHLFGPSWLLVYEGAVQGWLKPALPVVQSEKYFKELAQNNVRFFDLSREPEPVFKLKGEGISPEVSAYVFDSDEDVYEYFEFSESDEDYLGRRLRKDDDDEAGGAPVPQQSGIGDISNEDWDDLLL